MLSRLARDSTERAYMPLPYKALLWHSRIMSVNDLKRHPILDSRNKNAPLAHSLFTWNFSAHGHEYNHLAELPLFGHSENHAMIQLVDWISSAFLFPMATLTYCLKHESERLHIDKAYAPIRKMFGQRLKALQYRYELPDGTKRGGIHIQGKSIKLNSLLLFGDPPNEQK